MQRIDNSTVATELPVPASPGTPGFFTAGNAGTSVPATVVDADWLNMIQEELMAVIAAAGVTADKTNHAQVLASLKTIFAAAAGSSSQQFSVANAGQVNQALAIGQIVSSLGNASGYIKIPTFIGGVLRNFIIQVQAISVSASGTAIIFPIAFPNFLLALSVLDNGSTCYSYGSGGGSLSGVNIFARTPSGGGLVSGTALMTSMGW